MNRYWSTLIEPICDLVQPKSIAEIGAAAGLNTKSILEYCQRVGAHAHVIDPEPIGNHDEIRRLIDTVATVYETTSHAALPGIKSEIYIVDGDHNWFTVYHDMRLIEANFDPRAESMPIIIAHDVGWPYARRDMYYAADRVPAEYRQPYARMGIRYGCAGLVENGGYNHKHDNALTEGGPRNGVLTAIEDFVEGSSIDWTLTTFATFHGLGVLHAPNHMDQGLRRELEDLLHVSRSARALLEAVEVERVHLLTELVENYRNLGGRPGPRLGKLVRTLRRFAGRAG